MRPLSRFLAVLGLSLLTAAYAQAAPSHDQIATAIAGNDFKTIETIVKDNPDLTGHAENSLLQNAYTNLEDIPRTSAVAMTTASTLSPGIKPNDAKPVAESIRKIIQRITDKALFVCNPEANGNAAEVQTPERQKELERQKAIETVMEAAETIAKTPAVVAVDPQLFAEIAAQRAKCEEGALLAQQPVSPRPLPPHLFPVYPPKASPD